MENGFILEFPSQVELGTGEEPIPPGADEARLLCESLSGLGAACHSVFQRSFYGWDFVGRFEGRNYLFVLQLVDRRWSLTISQYGYTNFFTGRHRRRDSLIHLEKLAKDAIAKEFGVGAATVGWGFFGLSV